MNHSCLIILVWLYAVIILKAKKSGYQIYVRMQSLFLSIRKGEGKDTSYTCPPPRTQGSKSRCE